MATYYLDVTIPEKHYTKIWNKHFPRLDKILGNYFFVLSDTYGLTRRTILELFNEIDIITKRGDDVVLRPPNNWKPNKESRL